MMTVAGWMFSDGRLVTVHTRFRDVRAPEESLEILLEGFVSRVALADDNGVVRGNVALSGDGTRVWCSVAGRRFFAWTDDVRSLVNGDRVAAALHVIYGLLR